MDEMLTTAEAAEILAVTASRVRQMVMRGQLPAEKFGRDLMIRRSSLKLVEGRTSGRPPKATAEKPAKKARGKKKGAK